MGFRAVGFFCLARTRAVVFFLAVVLAGCTTVPYTGRSQLMLIAPQEEMAMGYKAAREIEKKEPLSRDPYYNTLVRRVGYRIAKAANRPDYKWEFHVIDKPKTVNAFCLPGGKIFVYTGLFKYARDESELACVVGHEVAHALARHGAERMSMVLLAQLGEAAALVAMSNQSEETQVAFLAAFGVATNLGIRFLIVPIDQTFQAYLNMLAEPFSDTEPDVTEENIQARIRGNILMALSNKFGWLVLTTGNKSELATGYCTLYGDMAGGFAVIKDVPKMLVYALAGHVNAQAGRQIIPQRVFDKAPTAELRPDQKDEDSLGPYRVLDPILHAYVEEDRSLGEIVALGFDEDTVRRVIRMVDRAEYKRRQAPPGVKITPRAFGKDRRVPITNRYREG